MFSSLFSDMVSELLTRSSVDTHLSILHVTYSSTGLTSIVVTTLLSPTLHLRRCRHTSTAVAAHPLAITAPLPTGPRASARPLKRHLFLSSRRTSARSCRVSSRCRYASARARRPRALDRNHRSSSPYLRLPLA